MWPAKIISGGQSGADLGALRASEALGIATGGAMLRAAAKLCGTFRDARDFVAQRSEPYAAKRH
jgi:hypothetical protein